MVAGTSGGWTSCGPSRLLICLLLLAFPSLGASQRRTALDYGLAAGSTALIVADWSQALRMTRSPNRWYEANPLVGRHPSEGRINTLATLYIVWNAGALFLPKTPRRVWYVAVTLVEAVAVIHNLSIGVSVGF